MDKPGTSDSRPILVEEDHDRCHDSDSQAESDDAGAKMKPLQLQLYRYWTG